MLATTVGLILAMGGTIAQPPALPNWFWGVTIDNVDDPDAIVDSLQRLPARAVTRLVFDDGVDAAYYRDAAQRIHDVGPVMGEPIDSVLTKQLTLQQYRDRMTSYMDTLKGSVDLWEIGNEVNGDWSGSSASVATKVAAAFKESEARGMPSALTLFYSDHYQDNEREMDAWSKKFLSAEVRNGVDYVLVSFYPQTALGEHPNWRQQFGRLAKTFPNAKLGFGELGLAASDYTLSKDPIGKEALMRRYYRMSSPAGRRFVGGYFWWSFRQDGVPASTPFWRVFAELLRTRP